MNMKSILFAATAALAVSLQAEVTANNTLCRIEVSSAAKSVIVAVPLVSVGGGSTVAVTDYIMTANLKDGDSILKWNTDSSVWEGWVINSGAWEASTSVSVNGTNTTANADDSALARGAAVWLNRSAETLAESTSFYLYGQVADSTDPVMLTAQAKAYTLIGNPTTDTLDLSDSQKVTWNNCVEGDQIILSSSSGTPKIFTYKTDTGWSKIVNSEDANGMPTTKFFAISSGDATLAVGEGFWYNSTDKSTSPTVTIK